MRRSVLYIVVMLACTAGLGWSVYLMTNPGALSHGNTSVCLFKAVTHVPCPSCGSSRAVVALLKGNVLSSLYWNPIGLIILSIMVISPVWIMRDVLTKRRSFVNFYRRTENILRIKWVAISAITLVLANWIWTISKGM